VSLVGSGEVTNPDSIEDKFLKACLMAAVRLTISYMCRA